MESKTSKKRTALLAAIVSVALLLTGTFAWVLQDDITLLNAFNNDNPGTYDVDLKENFKQWEQKQVWAENKGDNPIIVRIRFEEFFDLTYRKGSEYGLEKTNILEKTKGDIFKTETVTDLSAPSSTDLSKYITFKFGEGVVTMADYNAKKAANEDISGINWVIDTDGWCYYTKALTAADTNDPTNTAYRTTDLLKNVSLDEKAFRADFSEPFDLDYFVNVRLQAISADLDDFGSHIKDEQWTNVGYLQEGTDVYTGQGRVIAKTENKYEITTDTPITEDAIKLVVSIKNPANVYANNDTAVAVSVNTAEDFVEAVYDENVHSVLLTSDITLEAGVDPVEAYEDKLIDLGDYKITVADDFTGMYLFYADEDAQLTIRNGRIENKDDIICLAYDWGSVTFDNVEVDAGESWAVWSVGENRSVEFVDSTVTGDVIVGVQGGSYAANNLDIHISNSNLIATGGNVITHNSNGLGESAQNVNVVVENNSHLERVGGTILTPTVGWTVKMSDTTLVADEAVKENHNYPPASAEYTNCVFNVTGSAYFKVSDTPVTMKNCDINVQATAESGGYGMGMFIRSGDVTLDNVNIAVKNGEADNPRTDDVMDSYYATKTGGYSPNYEALQIVLNSYESINLNIIGGSYSTEVAGVNSVYVYDAYGTYNTNDSISGQLYNPDSYTWNNKITVDGATFSPEAVNLNETYTSTTITK